MENKGLLMVSRGLLLVSRLVTTGCRRRRSAGEGSGKFGGSELGPPQDLCGSHLGVKKRFRSRDGYIMSRLVL